MAFFGPAGNSLSFYEEGFKNSLQTPAWLKNRGLDCFEYSFGKGYIMSSETALKIKDAFKKEGVLISLHAPYYINFANPDQEMFEKTKNYIKNGIKYLKLMGADRLIFHPASCGKMKREDAFKLTKERFIALIQELDAEKMLDGIYICPETMGKSMQVGSVEEVVELCEIHDRVLPCFDFGHINSYLQGKLKSKEDFLEIFNYAESKLGLEKMSKCHIHFSKIEYGAKGEIRHLTFADNSFGPNYQPFIEAVIEKEYNPRIICESNGLMAEDAKTMKEYYSIMTKKV